MRKGKVVICGREYYTADSLTRFGLSRYFVDEAIKLAKEQHGPDGVAGPYPKTMYFSDCNIDQAVEMALKRRHTAHETSGPRFDEDKRVYVMPDGQRIYTFHEVAARSKFTHRTVKAMHTEDNIWKGIICQMPIWSILLTKDKYRQVCKILRAMKRERLNPGHRDGGANGVIKTLCADEQEQPE